MTMVAYRAGWVELFICEMAKFGKLRRVTPDKSPDTGNLAPSI